MTYEEALEYAKSYITLEGIPVSARESTACIVDALEKQIPKKPIDIHEICSIDSEGNVTGEIVYYRCPVCNKSIHVGKGCGNNECRQAIDWSDAE